MNTNEVLKLALETLEVWKGYMPALWDKTDEQAITALRQALANEALDKMAENARELGLDYEPVCNKDPQGCWSVRCQLGKKCKNTPAQQEPVAYIRVSKTGHVMACAKTADFYSLPDGALLYTHPQAREPLTDEEIEQCMKQAYATVQGRQLEHAFARAIEAAHGIKEKNT